MFLRIWFLVYANVHCDRTTLRSSLDSLTGWCVLCVVCCVLCVVVVVVAVVVVEWCVCVCVCFGMWLSGVGEEVIDSFAMLRRHQWGTRPEPFNFTPMGVNSISFGSPHVRRMGVHRTCGRRNQEKYHKKPHPNNVTGLCGAGEYTASMSQWELDTQLDA